MQLMMRPQGGEPDEDRIVEVIILDITTVFRVDARDVAPLD